MTTKVKGRTTFRIAAILFLLSAVFELIGISSTILLLGTYQSGLVAAAVHLLYAVLYLALGYGLWNARRWCYRLVFAATAIYTLDKMQYVIYRETILTEIMRQAGPYREHLQVIDQQMILQVLMLVAVLFAACWWGFAGYTYYRREYFQASNAN